MKKRRDWEQAGSSAAKRYCQEELHQGQSDTDSDMAEAEQEAEEAEIDEEEDEEAIAELRIRFKDDLIPEIRAVLGDERPDLLTDRTPRRCLVCPTMQTFTGWRALAAHARTITTKRVQRHRAYHEALEEVLKAAALAPPERDVNEIRVVRAVPPEKRKTVYPPVVVVENAASIEEVKRYAAGRIDGASVGSVVETSVKGVVLVVFERTTPAAVQASYLVKFFEDEKRGRGSRFRGMIGYAAEAEDMEALDPNKVIDWSLVNESVDYVQKAKEQDEAKIAALKEKQRSSKLEEENKAMQLDVSKVEQEFAEKPNEIEMLKKANADEKHRFDDWCDREQQISLRELRDMEVQHERKWKQLNLELEFNYRKTEKQRMEHFELLERLKEKRNSGTEQAKANSMKLLELEDEKTSFEKSLKAAEESLNAHFRLMEMQLLDEHDKESAELSKKYADQTEDTLKMQECSMCFEELGDNERARCVLNPCGHAKSCMACSVLIKECSICRAPIKSRTPLAASQPFYG